MLTKKKNALGMNSKRKTAKKVNFTMVAPGATHVFLAGDFTNWDINSHPLKASKGTWKTSVTLLPGRYEYRFMVDGDWKNDPHCTTLVPNSYGSENSVLTLEDK